jgi:hypothetical protein
MEANASYDILRFDAVMFDNSITKIPMIYIKPDLAFIDFIAKNNNVVVVTINGSDTIYDGKVISGVVDTSCNVPSCRPNFFDKTGYYVITLYSNWYGYPPNPQKLGTVSIKGLKMSMKKDIKEKYKSNRKVVFNLDPEIISKNYVVISVVAAILFIIIFIFIYRCEKKRI